MSYGPTSHDYATAMTRIATLEAALADERALSEVTPGAGFERGFLSFEWSA